MDIDVHDELKILSEDLGYLSDVYRRELETRSSVLRMLASKWEHVARLFKQQADELDREKVPQ